MPSLQGFVRGRDLLYLYVFPITVNADDTFTIPTLTSAMNMAGYVDYVRLGTGPTLELIQSIDITVANYMSTYDDFTLSLGEIMRKAGVNGTTGVLLANILAADNMGCQYAVRSDDPAGGPSIFTLIGTRGDFNTGVQSAGKNSNDLVIRPTTWADMLNNPLAVGNVTGITNPIWVID